MANSKLAQLLSKSVKQPILMGHSALVRLKNAYLMRTSSVHPAPVLVLGQQKAGTTAIAALLGKATGKSVTIDLFHELKLVDGLFREQLLNKQVSFGDFVENNKFYFSTDIIKDPNFTFLYEQLRDTFPKASFVFVMRDPRSNIRSILNRVNIPGNLEELDNTYLDSLSNMKGTGWKLLIEGRQPNVPGENYIEKLAHRWNLAADTYINHKDNIVPILYEDFIKDKVGAIAHLAKQLELPPVYDIAKEVDVQYQPRGNPNIKWLEFFGADNLQQIEKICGDRMKQFGYKPSENPQDAVES